MALRITSRARRASAIVAGAVGAGALAVFGLCDQAWAFSFRWPALESLVHPLRRGRHVHRAGPGHLQCISQRVHHRRRRAGGGALPGPLDAQRVVGLRNLVQLDIERRQVIGAGQRIAQKAGR